MVGFWKRELGDMRYSLVALQGLLRLKPSEGVLHVPSVMRSARNANPRIPMANTLFAVTMELGEDSSLWKELARAFEGYPTEFAEMKAVYTDTHLGEFNPTAWAILQSEPTTDAVAGVEKATIPQKSSPHRHPQDGYRSIYPEVAEDVRRALDLLPNGKPLLEPLAA